MAAIAHRVLRGDWEWVEKRNQERYANTVQLGKNYDAKNMLHVFRLLQMAGEIALTGEIQVRRPNCAFPLQTRRGELEYAELVAEAERLVAAFAAPALLAAPDAEAAEATLRQVRQQSVLLLARRLAGFWERPKTGKTVKPAPIF